MRPFIPILQAMYRWFIAHPLRIFLPLYILLLLAAETGVRYAWSGYVSPDRRNVVPDARVHHAYRPGTDFTTYPAPGDDFAPAHNTINALGMRGPLPAAKMGRRILLLGDSFVQADEVAFDQTFGQRLNAHFTPSIEFIAHGMVSWSPTPEFSWLHHRGIALQPDEVVLFLCSNDFYRTTAFHQTDARYREEAIYQGTLPIGYRLAPPTLWKKALRHSALLQLLRAGYGIAVAHAPLDPTPSQATIPGEIIHLAKDATQWPNDLRANVDATLAVVAEIDRYLRQREIALHIALVPLPFAWPDEAVIGKQHPVYGWPASFSISQRGLADFLGAFASDRDIGWIDLQTGFSQHKQQHPQRLFNGADGHWNEAGHRVVSEILRTYFSR